MFKEWLYLSDFSYNRYFCPSLCMAALWACNWNSGLFQKGFKLPTMKIDVQSLILVFMRTDTVKGKGICSLNGHEMVFENLEVRHMRLSWSRVTHFVMDSAMTNSVYNRKMKAGEDF